MARVAAFVVLVALTAAPARQLACVWECGEPAGSAQRAAACHETAADGPALAAAAAHCPLAQDAAVLTTGAASEPQRTRVVLALDRPAAADVGAMLHTFDIRSTWSPRHVHGHRSRTLPVLRI